MKPYKCVVCESPLAEPTDGSDIALPQGGRINRMYTRCTVCSTLHTIEETYSKEGNLVNDKVKSGSLEAEKKCSRAELLERLGKLITGLQEAEERKRRVTKDASADVKDLKGEIKAVLEQLKETE